MSNVLSRLNEGFIRREAGGGEEFVKEEQIGFERSSISLIDRKFVSKKE